MYKIDACPACASRNLDGRWAIVSPFLAHYSVRTRPWRCKLMECRECSLRFFDERLTPEEVGRLYSGYRGEEYFRERNRHEFWYSRKVNDGIGGDPAEIEKRRRGMTEFLGQHVDTAHVESVLDYGGDRGQFIPEAIGARKYVFELSDAVPYDGVTRISSEAELASRRFDLVMATGVLEHCSDPASVLRGMLPLLKNSQSLLYIGVPYERYRLGWVGRGKLYGLYLDALLKIAPVLTLADFYSTAARVKLDTVPPLGLVKCHEHLNFFDDRSMRALMAAAGFNVIGSAVTQVASYPVRVESLNVVARAA